MKYANAGHDLPYMRRGNEDTEELSARGMPLGLMAGWTMRRKGSSKDGDSVLFYSDGLVEAHDPKRADVRVP